ncbi:hypothetical protein BDV10DRAFT_198625 [Aspergillus recurvatus]
MPNSAKSVAIIGTGPAGLFAAWALQNDGYQVTIFEKAREHRYFTRRAEGVAGEDQPVDIPMRTFSGSHYANLFRVLEFLKVETRVHRFRYNFHRGGTQYFQFFSNFHQNTAWVNLYALACYLWYTIAVFLLPPRVRGTATSGQRKGETETLDQYARRIRLPSTFLEWYLLPLFSSVATCSHADLRECPAAYIVNYRKGTIGARHRTIVDMRALQGLLTRNVFQRLQTEVRSVRSESGRVELQFFESNDKTGLETEVRGRCSSWPLKPKCRRERLRTSEVRLLNLKPTAILLRVPLLIPCIDIRRGQRWSCHHVRTMTWLKSRAMAKVKLFLCVDLPQRLSPMTCCFQFLGKCLLTKDGHGQMDKMGNRQGIREPPARRTRRGDNDLLSGGVRPVDFVQR